MIAYPANPTNGQQFTADGRTWQYDSAKTAWKLIPVSTSDADRAATAANAAAASASSASTLLASVQATTNNRLLPTGGLVGQVPIKTSGGYAWGTVASSGGGGSAVVDHRKLAPLLKDTLTGKACDFIGDTTVARYNEENFVLNTGVAGEMQSYFPVLGKMTFRNYAAGTLTLESFATGGGAAAAAARLRDVYYISLGLYDEVTRPGLGAYNSAANIAEALRLQGFLQSVVTAIKAARSDACIIFQMPIPIMETAYPLGGGQTGQKVTDVLRLAYRGDVALGVPSPEAFGSNVLVFDTQAVAMPPNSLADVNKFVYQFMDGVNPNPWACRQILWPIALLMSGPPGAAIVSEAHSVQLAAREKAIASGWTTEQTNIDTILNSDEWVPTFSMEVGTNDYGVVDLFLGPFPGASQYATGATLGGNVGNLHVPGFAIGDVAVWGSGPTATLMTMTRTGDYHMGDDTVRFSTTFMDGKPNQPVLPAGYGVMYRHKYAHSSVMRRNALALESSNLGVRATAFPNAIRFAVVDATNGSLTVRAIYGEVGAQSGLNAAEHDWSTTDRICLAGVEVGDAGVNLSAATFSKSGYDVTITLADTDFTKRCGNQGFVLAAAVGATGDDLTDIFNESLL